MPTKKNLPKISLVFPVFNEEDIIEQTITAYYNELKDKIDFEIIVAEDGSTDRSKEILKRLEKKFSLRLYLTDERKGYQKAVIDSLKHPKNDWIFLVDSDYQFSPKDFWKLLPHIDKYDIILGIKVERKDPLHRIVLSKGFNFLLRLFFHVPYVDMDTGFRLIHKRALRPTLHEINCLTYFTSELVIRSSVKKFKIKEVPVMHYKRKVGCTNVFPLRRIPGVVVEEFIGLLKLKKDIMSKERQKKSKKKILARKQKKAADVEQHYKKISKQYYSKSNKHCEARYRKIIAKNTANAKEVLELGCGNAFLARHVKGRYTGVDISSGMLNKNKNLKKKDRLLCCDAAKLPFPDNTFDVVFSVNLLEHTPKPAAVIKEAQRVLKKGGRMIMITPNGNIGWALEIAEKLRLKIPEGPHRFLKRKELKRIVRKNRFRTRLFKEIMVCPFGPRGFSKRMGALEKLGFGLFHLVIAEKKK
jgi:ubiquinone/menaquinone biosynthesis C-methylase UbiE